MDEELTLPATVPADGSQKQAAFIAALLVAVPFIAIAPFGEIELPRLNSYIPVVDTVMLINDSIAATLLLAQFSILRSPSLLALAGGFLFTALLVIPHALSFPGAFAPNGLLDSGLQTTPWINEFWFLGLPSAVITYALLRRYDGRVTIPPSAVRFAIVATIVGAFTVTCALVWLSTADARLLPAIMSDRVHPQLAWHFLPIVILSSTAMVLLWSRRQAALDLWLLVVLEAWMLNAFLFNNLIDRFSLFWYCGRVFAALASIFILLFLLSETMLLYGRLARSHMMVERERNNKLLNVEAIASAIAHEIKQPLTAIAANASAALAFLGRTPPDLQDAKASLNDIVEDSHRISGTLGGIRCLVRKVDQEQERVDVNEIALDVLRSVRGELMDCGITVRPELTTTVPLIRGNRHQLQQVFLNLIQNSLEAMEATTGRDRVLEVRTEPRGDDAVALAVQDSGPGINPEHLDGIFEAFVTTKARGRGLGLAICRTIVEYHGGRLTASSDGKNGALFEVVLPVNPADARDIHAEPRKISLNAG
jgi:signal transduction histidine kinase